MSSAASVRHVVEAPPALGKPTRRERHLYSFDLVPLVDDDPIGDLPLATAPFETIDVSTAERLEEGAGVVVPTLTRADMGLDVRGVGVGELDDRVPDRVLRRVEAVAESTDRVGGEIEAEAFERSVVVRRVRVVNGCREISVAAVDAAAEVEEAAADRSLVDQALQFCFDREILA